MLDGIRSSPSPHSACADNDAAGRLRVINANIPEIQMSHRLNVRQSKYGGIISYWNARWLQGPERRSVDMTHKTDPQAGGAAQAVAARSGQTARHRRPEGRLHRHPFIFACRPHQDVLRSPDVRVRTPRRWLRRIGRAAIGRTTEHRTASFRRRHPGSITAARKLHVRDARIEGEHRH
jgi:hypothetical protein